jgi:hypothetical protein
VRFVEATGDWHADEGLDGIEITVHGYSAVDVSAPADTDPDDLSDAIAQHYDASGTANEFVCACGNAFGDEDALMAHVREGNAQSIEDGPPRGIEDGNGEPKPAGVEGHSHQRGGTWRDEPSGEHPVIEQRSALAAPEYNADGGA